MLEYCNTGNIFWHVFRIMVVIFELTLVFMPDKAHYSYEGDVIDKQVTAEHGINYMTYTYIENVTNDTMSIKQRDLFCEGYYTLRTNEREVYTYRWYLCSLVWLMPALIAFIIECLSFG